MTNYWVDIKNSDGILIMGSNAAGNHPGSLHWVAKAVENGATLINVDPPFLINPDFGFDESIFSSCDAAGRKRDKSIWAYQTSDGTYRSWYSRLPQHGQILSTCCRT